MAYRSIQKLSWSRQRGADEEAKWSMRLTVGWSQNSRGTGETLRLRRRSDGAELEPWFHDDRLPVLEG